MCKKYNYSYNKKRKYIAQKHNLNYRKCFKMHVLNLNLKIRVEQLCQKEICEYINRNKDIKHVNRQSF